MKSPPLNWNLFYSTKRASVFQLSSNTVISVFAYIWATQVCLNVSNGFYIISQAFEYIQINLIFWTTNEILEIKF